MEEIKNEVVEEVIEAAADVIDNQKTTNPVLTNVVCAAIGAAGSAVAYGVFKLAKWGIRKLKAKKEVDAAVTEQAKLEAPKTEPEIDLNKDLPEIEE